MSGALTGAAALVTAFATWRSSKKTQAIVQGNGRGDVATMAKATLEQLEDLRHLLIRHVGDTDLHGRN